MSCPIKIFQHENFYHENLITRIFLDLRYIYLWYLMQFALGQCHVTAFLCATVYWLESPDPFSACWWWSTSSAVESLGLVHQITSKISKIYNSASEGVLEWSGRPLKITWDAAKSKIELSSFFLCGEVMTLMVKFVIKVVWLSASVMFWWGLDGESFKGGS